MVPVWIRARQLPPSPSCFPLKHWLEIEGESGLVPPPLPLSAQSPWASYSPSPKRSQSLTGDPLHTALTISWIFRPKGSLHQANPSALCVPCWDCGRQTLYYYVVWASDSTSLGLRLFMLGVMVGPRSQG